MKKRWDKTKGMLGLWSIRICWVSIHVDHLGCGGEQFCFVLLLLFFLNELMNEWGFPFISFIYVYSFFLIVDHVCWIQKEALSKVASSTVASYPGWYNLTKYLLKDHNPCMRMRFASALSTKIIRTILAPKSRISNELFKNNSLTKTLRALINWILLYYTLIVHILPLE